MKSDQITILGAGLVGSLLASLLADKGYQVHVFEKRSDPRNADRKEGRSINLALSHRGIKALQLAGVYTKVEAELIPMKGRLMHDVNGQNTVQPYGLTGQYINSVSRSGLNEALIDHAEKKGAKFHFEEKCLSIDIVKTEAHLEHQSVKSDLIIGADGAFSQLRKTLQNTDRFNFEQFYLAHGYKELKINPRNGDFALEKNYLHIWPRGHFMLIALPNPDRSFTATLFFPYEGNPSFESVNNKEEIIQFFKSYFPDIPALIPDFVTQYQSNPTSSLVTIKTNPWYRNRCMIIGDASHAIVPFYGQGMNAGFEDCRIFMQYLEKLEGDWDQILAEFSRDRKPDADAISDLAMKNFVEMRDSVADQRFLDIKKVETRLQKEYPDVWLPLYSMVTFSDIPYHEALKIGKIQEEVMSVLPETFDPEKVDLQPLIDRFNARVKAAQTSSQ